jgi:hypothetical protein
MLLVSMTLPNFSAYPWTVLLVTISITLLVYTLSVAGASWGVRFLRLICSAHVSAALSAIDVIDVVISAATCDGCGNSVHARSPVSLFRAMTHAQIIDHTDVTYVSAHFIGSM